MQASALEAANVELRAVFCVEMFEEQYKLWMADPGLGEFLGIEGGGGIGANFLG